MIDEARDDVDRRHPPHSALMERSALLEVLKKTFYSMDKKAVDNCPSGCLVVLWPGERKET